MANIPINVTIDDEAISTKIQKIIEKEVSTRLGTEIRLYVDAQVHDAAKEIANTVIQNDGFLQTVNDAIDKCLKERIERLLRENKIHRVIFCNLTNRFTEDGRSIKSTLSDEEILESLMATGLFRGMEYDEDVKAAVIDGAIKAVYESVAKKAESRFNKMIEKNTAALKLLDNIAKLKEE